MKIILALCTLFGLTSSRFIIPNSVDPLSQNMIDYINNANTTWKAQRNFEGVTSEDLKRLMGVRIDGVDYKLPEYSIEIIDDIPKTFDSREEWPDCYTIGKIRDQGCCGSCWAIAATESMSDRICIKSNGKVVVELSTEDLLTCCNYCGNGCDGGFPGTAWQYWVYDGIVTGGDYQSHEGCQPYLIPPTKRTAKGALIHCRKPVQTPYCVPLCEKSYNNSYYTDKYYGKTAYSVANDVQQIQSEIMRNGPVEADFDVFADFPHYKSGVYQSHSHYQHGRHSVRILGWGEENGVPYWLVANSWSAIWGEKGYFKILRGENECGIESSIVAGLPKL